MNKKSKHFFWILFLALTVGSCALEQSFILKKKSDFSFTEKRVLVVTYDTELSRDFVISLKNYVSRALKSRQVQTANVNLSQVEPIYRIEEYEKLIQNFQPHYELIISVKKEQARTGATFSEKTYQLNGCGMELTIKDRTSGSVVALGALRFDKIYESEKLTMIREMTKTILADFQKNLIIN